MIALGVLAAVFGFFLISAYNNLIALRNQTANALKQIDVQLKRRHDLIPNLVNTVKGYAAHEKGTLEAVISARASATRPNITMDERMKAEQGLSGALARLMAVAEAYPDLKANQNFLHLQGELSNIENGIAGARGGYNGAVQQFNATARQFPALIIARFFGFNDMPFFEVDDPAQRNAPQVQF